MTQSKCSDDIEYRVKKSTEKCKKAVDKFFPCNNVEKQYKIETNKAIKTLENFIQSYPDLVLGYDVHFYLTKVALDNLSIFEYSIQSEKSRRMNDIVIRRIEMVAEFQQLYDFFKMKRRIKFGLNLVHL